MTKRNYEEQKFPEILEHIRTGRYTTLAPSDTGKYKQKITWSLMHLIYDDTETVLPDFYFCSKCGKIYNLKLCDNGKTLKRHVEKCSLREQITDFFAPEMVKLQSKKIKLADKNMVRDAVVEYIVKDMRPVSSVSGDGIRVFLSSMTYIGAKYGYLTPEAIEKTHLLPSRQTVIYFSPFFHLKLETS